MTARASALFMRGDSQEDAGRFRPAFRLFLSAAKAGDLNAQSRVGYCYDIGCGVRPNRTAALYWYKRAYRRGDPIAAHNIGTIGRDERQVKRAERWFQRAVDLGFEDSNLDIAKLFLDQANDPRKAILYLNRVLRLVPGWKPDKEEARRLLKHALRKLRLQRSA
jgi:TPR repeat protein